MIWSQFTPEERRETLEPFARRQRVCPFTMEELTRWAILTTVQAYGGNRTWAARHLKLSIRTIRGHLVRYREDGFYVPPFRGTD